MVLTAKGLCCRRDYFQTLKFCLHRFQSFVAEVQSPDNKSRHWLTVFSSRKADSLTIEVLLAFTYHVLLHKCRFTVCKVLAALIYRVLLHKGRFTDLKILLALTIRVLLHKSRFAVCNWDFACINSDLQSVTEVVLHTLMQICRLKGFACTDLPCFAVEGQSLDCGRLLCQPSVGPLRRLLCFPLMRAWD